MHGSSSSSSSSSSSRIYYFDREGPTDVAVLLQGTLSALYRAKQKRRDAQPDDTRQAENSTYPRQGSLFFLFLFTRRGPSPEFIGAKHSFSLVFFVNMK